MEVVKELWLITCGRSEFCQRARLLILRVRIGFNARRSGNMGVEVQNREQVDNERESRGDREREEEDKTKKQPTLRHVMTCG